MYKYKYVMTRSLKQALVVTFSLGGIAIAQSNFIVPPPMPIGSHMVQQNAGMSPVEVSRNKRAHHHNKHHKKNIVRDDTLDDAPEDKEQENKAGKQPNRPKSK
jgi:hypothetical protein